MSTNGQDTHRTLDEIPVGSTLRSGYRMPLPQRLHLINLGVTDLAASLRFYEKLGWLSSPVSHAGYIKFNLEGFALCLIPLKVLRDDAQLPTSASPQSNPTVAYVHLAGSVDEVVRIFERVVAAGGTVVKPVTRTPWGVAGYFADPDGHLFEVDFEEQYVFDEQGRLQVDVVPRPAG